MCFESKERLPPTHTHKKKKKKISLSSSSTTPPPPTEKDHHKSLSTKSTSSSNNAPRDFDDFDDFDDAEEEEETRKKKERDLSAVFLSFQKRGGRRSFFFSSCLHLFWTRRTRISFAMMMMMMMMMMPTTTTTQKYHHHRSPQKKKHATTSRRRKTTVGVPSSTRSFSSSSSSSSSSFDGEWVTYRFGDDDDDGENDNNNKKADETKRTQQQQQHPTTTTTQKPKKETTTTTTTPKKKKKKKKKETPPNNNNEEEKTKKKSVCIVGGCGRIGSLLTAKIVRDSERYDKVHVLTRDARSERAEKMRKEYAAETATSRGGERLTIGECDVVNDTAEKVRESVKGYDEVIACFGAQRISKPFDWITNAENADETHPKSVNFLGVRKLAFAAKESGCERFVRVTGMSVGYSAFDFIAVLLNNVLSMTIKFQLLGELAIRDACVANDETQKRMSYTIVRPGNLTDQEGIDANDENSTNNSNSDGSTTTKTVKKNNENVVVLTHGTNHIDASKISREDVASLIYVALQNREATENVTLSISGANKATSSTRSAFRWDPARGAYWETQAVDDANVQVLSKWSEVDVNKFQPDEKDDLKEKAHQFWAWSFLFASFGGAYLFVRAVFSLVCFLAVRVTSSGVGVA